MAMLLFRSVQVGARRQRWQSLASPSLWMPVVDLTDPGRVRVCPIQVRPSVAGVLSASAVADVLASVHRWASSRHRASSATPSRPRPICRELERSDFEGTKLNLHGRHLIAQVAKGCVAGHT